MKEGGIKVNARTKLLLASEKWQAKWKQFPPALAYFDLIKDNIDFHHFHLSHLYKKEGGTTMWTKTF